METSRVMDLDNPVITTIKGKNEHWKKPVAMHINDVIDKCDACIGTDTIDVLLNKRDACVGIDFVSFINDSDHKYCKMYTKDYDVKVLIENKMDFDSDDSSAMCPVNTITPIKHANVNQVCNDAFNNIDMESVAYCVTVPYHHILSAEIVSDCLQIVCENVSVPNVKNDILAPCSDKNETVHSDILDDLPVNNSIEMSMYEPGESDRDVSDSDSDISDVSVEVDDELIENNESIGKKFICYAECLQELFRFCPQCGSFIIAKTEYIQGSMLTIKLDCHNGHNVKWNSQPTLCRMAAGNLELSCAILFSGGTYARLSHFAKLINIQFFSKQLYNIIKNNFLFPVINTYWEQHQDAVQAVLSKSNVRLVGDGRCDSPGFSAKYCTYSVMDEKSNLVIDFQVKQVSETGSSVTMEKAACEIVLNRLRGVLDITVFGSDRHVQIGCMMKNVFPEIQHEFDIFMLLRGFISVCAQLLNKNIVKN